MVLGGMGSGLYGSGGGKIAVEQCRRIDIRRLQREHLLNRSSFIWSWFDDQGNSEASITIIPKADCLKLSYNADGEPIKTIIPYNETAAGFGKRKWFLCPFCGARCAVLYLKGKYFACRKCHNLNYRSSQLSGDPVYYHRQLEKLCDILKAKYEPLDIFPPWKPRGMHWRTYEKHARRYHELAEKRDRLFLAGTVRLLNRTENKAL